MSNEHIWEIFQYWGSYSSGSSAMGGGGGETRDTAALPFLLAVFDVPKPMWLEVLERLHHAAYVYHGCQLEQMAQQSGS